MVSTSTCEDKYIAQHEAAGEAVWLRGFLGEIGVSEAVIEDVYLLLLHLSTQIAKAPSS